MERMTINFYTTYSYDLTSNNNNIINKVKINNNAQFLLNGKNHYFMRTYFRKKYMYI